MYESVIEVTKHTANEVAIVLIAAPITWREHIDHLTKNSEFGPRWTEHRHWPRVVTAKTSAIAALVSVPTTRCSANSSNSGRTPHFHSACRVDGSVVPAVPADTDHFATV